MVMRLKMVWELCWNCGKKKLKVREEKRWESVFRGVFVVSSVYKNSVYTGENKGEEEGDRGDEAREGFWWIFSLGEG